MDDPLNYPGKRYTGEKPWMNKDWLYEEYVVKDRSSADIAKEYGCVQNTIQCWLLKHGIKKQIVTHNIVRSKQYQQYDFLYEQHIVLNKSMAQIARECGVSSDTIRENMSFCMSRVARDGSYHSQRNSSMKTFNLRSSSQGNKKNGSLEEEVLKALMKKSDTIEEEDRRLKKLLVKCFCPKEIMTRMSSSFKGRIVCTVPGAIRISCPCFM